MNVLIIEDELAAFRGLKKMLKEINPEIKVAAHLTSVREAVRWFDSNLEPDLIFLDIQLSDGVSFKIFERTESLAPVIFCTAFNQYAIEAFKLNSIDYLLKPYQRGDLDAALKKFDKLGTKQEPINYEVLSKMLRKATYKERFLVTAGKKFYQISTTKIAYLFTRNKVNFLRTKDNRQYVVDEYLDELEKLLDPAIFFRINRQFIISIDAVVSLESDYGKYFVHLNPTLDEDISVSRNKVSEFKKWLGQS